MSNVKEFTDENFDIELKNTTDPVIVDFLLRGAVTAVHRALLSINLPMN